MKQYLLLCDEPGMASLKALLKPETVQFLEVQGMALNGGNSVNILVTPILPPVTPMPPLPAPPAPPQPAEAPPVADVAGDTSV